MVRPIWATSLRRDSFPERLWSIFRWAIDRHVVPPDRLLRRPLAVALVERDDQALPARLRRHHRHLGACDELARVRGVLGADGDSGRDVSRPTASASIFASCSPIRSARDVELRRSPDGRITANSSPPTRQTTSRRAHRRAEDVGDLVQQLVAHAVPVDVVHLLEVVEVEHHDRDGVVCRRRPQERLAQAVVERAVVVEAGESVGLGLVLETRADVRVVDRERRGVAEALREEELLVGERRVLADAVDVERSLQPPAGDERYRDQGLRLDRRCPARSARVDRGAPGSRARPRGGRPPSR